MGRILYRMAVNHCLGFFQCAHAAKIPLAISSFSANIIMIFDIVILVVMHRACMSMACRS
jgi:hypothetical protein